jgi:hypothetical protein
VTTTTLQSWTPVAIPARDENGAALGAGLDAWLQVYTALGTGATVSGATISYTNSQGVSGRTGTIADIAAAAKAGTVLPIQLQAGDTGIRSIEGITLGTSLVSGAIGLCIGRRLGDIPVLVANTGNFRNFFDIGAKLYSGTSLEIQWLATGTAGPTLFGTFQTCEG